jgi:multiple antibiotic resistance protein
MRRKDVTKVSEKAMPRSAKISVLFCIAALLYGPSALARAAAVPSQAPLSLSFGEMFTAFFLMLGPLKIVGPFVQMTRKADAAFARRLAFRAFAFSCAALLIVAIVGENSLRRYHISLPVLGVTTGLILFLAALRTVMQEFDATAKAPAKEYEPDPQLALFPLCFPTIVTPYGIAAVIVCTALTSDYLAKGEIYAALLGLMVLNLVAMLFAKPILKHLGLIMVLVGTILSVIQVALGLAIIFRGLRGLGFVGDGS